MKKFWQILKNILVWLVVLAAVGMMVFTIFSVRNFDQSHRSIFGYKFFIVRSDSMSATDFDAGDIIFVRETDPSTLQPGDIVSYTSRNTANFGETVTHKIRSLTTDAEGQPGFITYGTTTGIDDETVVTYDAVLGQYAGRLPGVGKFFAFLKTTPGYILCILVPFLLLILLEGLRCIRLFQEYKYEQQAELRAQQEQIRQDREQAQKMRDELMELMERIESLDKS